VPLDSYVTPQPDHEPDKHGFKYTSLKIDYARLASDYLSEAEMAKLTAAAVGTNETCESISWRLGAEVFEPAMLQRNRSIKATWPGGAQRALWRWGSGRITWQQFNATPIWQVKDPVSCPHCGFTGARAGCAFEGARIFVTINFPFVTI
jgi:hypothetical protein